jgi:hypothetical protein
VSRAVSAPFSPTFFYQNLASKICLKLLKLNTISENRAVFGAIFLNLSFLWKNIGFVFLVDAWPDTI